jgi:hypothetical protein
MVTRVEVDRAQPIWQISGDQLAPIIGPSMRMWTVRDEKIGETRHRIAVITYSV